MAHNLNYNTRTGQYGTRIRRHLARIICTKRAEAGL